MQKRTRGTPNTPPLPPSQPNVLPTIRIGWLLGQLLLLVLPVVGHAQVPDFLYDNNNGALTLTRYLGTGGAVTIPDTVNDLPVCNIGDQAFSTCTSLTSVVFPNSVTNIGAAAFYGCSGLTSVTLPANLLNIGDSAFSSCTNLMSVSLSSGVTNLGPYAFSECSGLTNVLGGEGLICIGDAAFHNCAGLLSVPIPDGITTLGGWAFAGCASLTNVALPGSVTNIGYLAFQNCTHLRAITVDALNPAYSSVDGVLFDRTQTTLLACPGGKAGAYSIPDGVTNIDSAFNNCVQLTSVTLPSSLTSVAGAPFVGCTNLEAILVVPQNPAFSSVGGVWFDKSQTTLLGCPGHKSGSYTLPDSTVTIGSYAFASCARLTSVTLGHKVTVIGSDAFLRCNHLALVQLPNSLTNIEDGAFGYCSHLSSITIPSQVSHIGTLVFMLCQSLKSIAVDALNPVYSSAGGVLFNKRQTMVVQYPPGRLGSSYTIPTSVTNIGDFAFGGGCWNLTRIAGGTNLLGIGAGAFSGCLNLTNLPVLSNVVELGDNAFRSCEHLSAITLGPRLASIGTTAFASCPHLTAVFFQGDAPTVGEYAFENDGLTTVYYLSGTQGWDATLGDCPTALWDGAYTITVSASSLTDASSGGSVEGDGTFVGGNWRTVQATPSPGYVFAYWTEYDQVVSTSPTYTFLLLSDRDLVANFAPKLFPALAGTYQGLIWNTNAATVQNSGCFTLTVSGKGGGSGTVRMGGVRLGFSGQFDYAGHLSARLPNGDLEVQLDGTSATGQVSGSVSNLEWVAALTGERTVFNAKTQPAANYASRYTLVFTGDSGATNAPVGDSWATLSVTPSGLVHLGGALADGTKVTQGASLSQDGVWPLYASLYQRRGMLVGWMGLTNSLTNDLSGTVMWTRPPTRAESFPEGFLLTTTATGSRYVPSPGAVVLNLTNAALVLAGPGLTQGITNYVTLYPNNRVDGTNHTRLSFNLATGTFKGSVPVPDNSNAQPISFSGVVLQKQNYGCGWFGGQGLWGEMTLSQ